MALIYNQAWNIKNYRYVGDVSTCKQATQGHREFTQVQAARRLKALLLHVWIEWIIMVWLTRMDSGVNPEGAG